MKSRLFLISVILLAGRLSAFACSGPGITEPQWHWIFYTGYESADKDWKQKLDKEFREENTTFWHNRVKKTVSHDIVENAIYRVYLINEQTSDPFFHYIYEHHDSAAIKYWTLLKSTDTAYISKAAWEQSIWYYSEKDDYYSYWYDEKNRPKHDLSISQVDRLDESAIRQCNDKDIRNRFLLQVMRKCFFNNDYKGCITLWKRYGNAVPESVLRKQCLNYYAGALKRSGNNTESAIVYAEIGYFDRNMFYNADELRNVYRKYPNNKGLEFMVQEFVNNYFDKSCAVKLYNSRNDKISISKLSLAFNELAEEVLQDGRCYNPALWKSAQAAIAYIDGKTEAALRLIAEAGKLRGTPAVKDNIRMMRLVFNSTRTDIDRQYEEILLPDLKWLVSSIEKDDIPEYWQSELSGEYEMITPPSTALHHLKIFRRTILLGVVPHFERCGMVHKSMAYLNLYNETMVSDREKTIRNYSRRGLIRNATIKENNIAHTAYTFPPIYREVFLRNLDFNSDYSDNIIMSDKILVADSTTWKKNLDYQTIFFAYMDTASIASIQRYVDFMRSGGKTKAEKFVLQHNYRDLDFYNELIATKYMRNEKYKTALVHLRKMSPKFPTKQNISEYINGTDYNPFAESWITKRANKADFGLSFNPAVEYNRNPGKAAFCELMLRLQKLAETDSSAEIRARAAYAYAVGLYNSSLGKSWALCYYEQGWNWGWGFNDGGLSEPGNDKTIAENSENRVNAWLDRALKFNKDDVFTIKCKVLHSRKRESLKHKRVIRHEYPKYSYTDTVKMFVPEVRTLLCDRACDYESDMFCTEAWTESVWYY